MADDKAEENDTGDGHDGFFTDSGLPKSQGTCGQISGGGAHELSGSFAGRWIVGK